MTVMEHALEQINKGIESVQAHSGTFADADPIAVIAVGASVVLSIVLITLVVIIGRR